MCLPGSPSPPSPPPRYEDEISKRTDMEFTFVQLKKVASPAHPMGSFPRDPLPSFAQDPQTKAPQAESQDHRQKAKYLSPPSSKALSQVSGNLPHRIQEVKSPLPHPCPGPLHSISHHSPLLPPPGPGCRMSSTDRTGDQVKRPAELCGADEKHL